MSYAGLPWSGGGPWRINPDCPSPIHNSLAAGRGRIYASSGKLKQSGRHCICLRARMLIEQDNISRRRRQRDKAATKPAQRRARPTVNVAVGTWVPDGVHVPDLSAGACRSLLGMRAFDLVISGNGGAHRQAVATAKGLCRNCPVREACEGYVRDGEAENPGIWRGVWAGKTAAERRAAKNVKA